MNIHTEVAVFPEISFWTNFVKMQKKIIIFQIIRTLTHQNDCSENTQEYNENDAAKTLKESLKTKASILIVVFPNDPILSQIYCKYSQNQLIRFQFHHSSGFCISIFQTIVNINKMVVALNSMKLSNMVLHLN